MIGRWGPKSGKTWLADVKIEAGGFMNILRRESAPLTITSEDGQTTFTEGKDFSNVQDAKLLNDPKPGYFTHWHDIPEVKIPAGSALKEGQKVLASYNYLQPSGKPKQMTACLAEPKIYEIIEKQINFIKTNIDPDAYMMSYDEIRSGGYDDACVKCGKTQGQLLAESVKKCTEIIEKVAPDKVVLAWNDMFDPHHNANPDLAKQSFFYSVKGEKNKNPWATSWDGVSTDVGILTWQKKAESTKFFNDRGSQVLLAGYYDHDPKAIVDWLKAVEGNKNMVGVMYTTWVRDYSKIEEFIDHVKKYESEGK
jgi:hypothetical protein